MREPIRGDAAHALRVEEFLVPDLMVGEGHVLAAVELRSNRRLELVGERFGNPGGHASDVAVAEIEGEPAVLAHADDAPNDQRFSREGAIRSSRSFPMRPRAFVGCKRLLGRRLAGPFRCGAGSALIAT